MTEHIIPNLKTILQRIDLACAKSNRDAASVRLLLATKTVSADRIKIAIETGQT